MVGLEDLVDLEEVVAHYPGQRLNRCREILGRRAQVQVAVAGTTVVQGA